jgi:G:T-mismatch repair DNA endonuclease (very short patch repair protein)
MITEETRRRMSESHKGKIATDETRIKMSESRKGEKHPFYGKRFSEEHKHKLSVAHMGKYPSEETRLKLGDSRRGENNCWYGKKFSDEYRRKLSIAHRGIKLSDAAKLKVSESSKQRWTDPKYREKQISKMKNGKFCNTIPEIILQQRLSEQGILFETQKDVYGIPDIFIEPNICIFADGDYWHGSTRPKAQERDRRVNEVLESTGYKVYRFWEHEIKSSPEECINRVLIGVTNE